MDKTEATKTQDKNLFTNAPVFIERVNNGFIVRPDPRHERQAVFYGVSNEVHVFETLPALVAWLLEHFPAG